MQCKLCFVCVPVGDFSFLEPRMGVQRLEYACFAERYQTLVYARAQVDFLVIHTAQLSLVDKKS